MPLSNGTLILRDSMHTSDFINFKKQLVGLDSKQVKVFFI